MSGLEALTRPVRVCVYSPGARQATEDPAATTPELRSRLAEQHERHEVAWIPDTTPPACSDHNRALELARQATGVTGGRVRPLLRDTIEEALDRFLAEQRKFLPEETLEEYNSIIKFLQYTLNNYGPIDLFDEDEKRLLEDASANPESKTFCQTFGPKKIPGAIGMFLGYYIPRTLGTNAENPDGVGPVMRRLANWLIIQSYGIPAVDVQHMLEHVEEFASAQRLRRRWNLLREPDLEFDESEIEDSFAGSLRIRAVEPGVIQFEEPYEDRDWGNPLSNFSLTVTVPHEISELAKPGWEMHVEAILVKGAWITSETGDIYI
ncbi:hypothetical protein ACFUYE_16835 [Micromonospora humida]|uniref:hypothetical protein n=1 Tax=Micromonospora humida TaxID=2809018 RepID=UPI00366EA3F5